MMIKPAILFPGRSAARRDALQTRDRDELGVWRQFRNSGAPLRRATRCTASGKRD
jgi:hypothetical protein